MLAGGRVVAAGSAVDGGVPQVAVLRTASSLILADGFERGSSLQLGEPLTGGAVVASLSRDPGPIERTPASPGTG